MVIKVLLDLSTLITHLHPPTAAVPVLLKQIVLDRFVSFDRFLYRVKSVDNTWIFGR